MKADFLRRLGHRPAAVATVLFVIALLVRLPGLGDFMTADEENWMLRSDTFWHQLVRERDPGGTFMTTHPGAPTMWLAGAGILFQEARLGFDIDTSNLRQFRLAATLPVALATAVLVSFAGLLLVRLFGPVPGGMAALVLAVDPYLTGMSQIVHLDALLALFMLIAVLSFFLWRAERNHASASLRWLLISGAAAGLALSTKFVPALWLFIFFSIFLAVKVRSMVAIVRTLGVIGAVAVVTLYATWPALWVKDDFFRSFERDVPAVVTQEHVALETSEEPIEPASFYIRTMLGRSMPFVFILSLGALVAVARYWWWECRLPTVWWLFIYATGFLVLITLAAKKADRYALPALALLPVIAGWTFGVAVLAWGRRRPGLVPHLFAVIVVCVLLGHSLLLSPHAIAYNSPLFPDVRPASQQGWGEGLEEAATWLNNHRLAEKLTVASWYPGVLGTYYNGATMSLSSRDDERVGFVVLYRNMFGRGEEDVTTGILEEFVGAEPAHVVSIHGEPYVFIFDTIGLHYFAEHTGEILGGMEIGQTVPVATDGWNSIEIGFATFSSRPNTADIVLHVRESPDAVEDIRTVVVNAAAIEDQSWHHFRFEPIPDSAGKTYYVALTSPHAIAGNAIAAWFAQEDVLPGQLLLRRRERGPREQNRDFLRQGDLAYRLP